MRAASLLGFRAGWRGLSRTGAAAFAALGFAARRTMAGLSACCEATHKCALLNSGPLARFVL